MDTPYDLRTGLGYQLTIAARTNNADFEAALARLGITRQMWCVLVAVGEQNITAPSAIADYIGIIRPAASRTLKQMDQKGLLHRKNGQTDKRTTTVALTDQGRDVLDRSMPMALATRSAIDGALTANEQQQLSQLLAKLTSSLQTTATGV
ncbi:MarR family transcriptional regulator [Amylibacter sp. IMCC11727]|uniref:MarR family winged helix-turn-helix transcriptional regulator n=1 Tax=Amylibacter sp. IMCC11727 TaxID=3039851 RepID=UPI00244DD247|nr:MarR family transcriptional regulator [Amylibacter sp. IMCC11727]WGI20979.1 winged helix DNA-binding protein [Amylibacter sp. IMCC11727]